MKTELRRQERIAARKQVAEQVNDRINNLGNYTVNFIYMGFWARMRWIIFGQPIPKVTKIAAPTVGPKIAPR